ncbi:MAG TPA: hypothetical protein VMF55_09065 [Solirubrobacterales bacterium]|nr:hypothetical protein [Solirubrobacterales bacterium]
MVASLCAALASSAAAEVAETGKSQWYISGKALAVGSGKSVNCVIGEHNAEKKVVLTTTVGKVALKLTATGIACPGGEIEEEEPNGVKMAVAQATSITFTGVSVSEPANCSTSAKLITEPLEAFVQMEKGSATKAFVKFAPKNGSLFIKIPITGENCAIANPEYEIKGTVYGEAVNPTGTGATEQPVTFSEAIQNTAGGALTFGSKPAQLTGRAIFTNLNGANESFSAKEV